MYLLDFRAKFLRIFMKHSLEEIKVAPLEDFELEDLHGDEIRFIEGEERKIPRWVARILSEHGKVHIKEETKEELISKLSTYQAEEVDKSLLGEIEEDFYVKMKTLLNGMGKNGEKEKVINLFKKLMKLRLPKIAKKIFVVGSRKNLTNWENILAEALLSVGEEWMEAPLEKEEKVKNILLSE